MPSITAWTRLEPRARRGDPTAGLEARVYDPLWLLAKQWQVGEFTGEDAGSPLQLRVRLEQSPLTRYRAGRVPAGPVTGEPWDPRRCPLEVMVEREASGGDLRRARDEGQHFLRMLAQRGAGALAGAFATAYPLGTSATGPRGREADRLLRLADGRVPDGPALAAALRAAAGNLPAQPPVPNDLREAVLDAAAVWLDWLDVTADPGGDAAWSSERMEYSFAVAAPAPAPPAEYVLESPEYPGGHLDWHAFDLRRGAALGASAEADEVSEVVRTAIPAPVSFRGMPVTRWWEFEDGQVNLATMDAGPSDLLRLLLLGFALDYGNDWFIVPVELPLGALYRVSSLVVVDSFGVETLVRPYADAVGPEARWRAFELSEEENTGLLFLPPALPQGQHGDAIEELLLLRDEVANLAWAVERRVADAAGRPFDRFEGYQRERPAAPTPQPGEPDELRFRLANSVPDYWFPLVATRMDPASPDVRLVRGRMLAGEASPMGRLLEPEGPLSLYEEEVPRAGSRVTRSWQYVRWSDGGAHLWIGRRKQPGRGEGASGLRFDSLVGL